MAINKDLKNSQMQSIDPRPDIFAPSSVEAEAYRLQAEMEYAQREREMKLRQIQIEREMKAEIHARNMASTYVPNVSTYVPPRNKPFPDPYGDLYSSLIGMYGENAKPKRKTKPKSDVTMLKRMIKATLD